ncbi:MAG: Helix-turn-helix type 11 domain protein [Firmicutes bacterium]|nr:Helix-turn-helix type 11 domain protein [Bacillota bacterium]
MAKAGNMLAVLWLLRSRRRMTAHQLAAELEISVRTVYRYIDDLCASGVPVLADSGHEGGYSLPDSFRGAPLIFEPDELAALSQAALFARAAGHPLSEALGKALAKVGRNLTAEQKRDLQTGPDRGVRARAAGGGALGHLPRYLLTLGTGIRVAAPADLRAELAALARAWAEYHNAEIG